MYVIDGVFVLLKNILKVVDEDSYGIFVNLLFNLNFNDIEFILVLKDVFVVLLYGLCVVNGVVMIIIK